MEGYEDGWAQVASADIRLAFGTKSHNDGKQDTGTQLPYILA